jgi:hypothetical protein
MTSSGYISPYEIYCLAEAKRRLNMGRHSFALLRRAGLPTLKVGRNSYVEGVAILDAIRAAAAQQAANRNQDDSKSGEIA